MIGWLNDNADGCVKIPKPKTLFFFLLRNWKNQRQMERPRKQISKKQGQQAGVIGHV